MFRLEINGTFPFIHKFIPKFVAIEGKLEDLSHKRWVTLPDGRKGVVDHIKRNGLLAVRPVVNGEYCLNPTLHWSLEERKAIPEEIVLSEKEIR